MLEAAERIGLQAAAERGPDGGPLLDEEETVLHKFERLQLFVGGTLDQGEGTLFITEWRVLWLSAAEPSLGFCVDFTTVAMHAVAAEDESSPRPCLYLQLDSGEEGEGGGPGADSGSEGEGEEGGGAEEVAAELRLVPADAAQLEPLFQAFCEGAERNPDWSEEEEEGEGAGFFFNEDEVLAGAAAAALGVDDVEELVGADPGRFEDAEGDEGEAAGAAMQPNGAPK